MSEFLERFVPELLSPEFLHAASPNSGTINAMASNVFNLMCSPPFVDFIAAELLPHTVLTLRLFRSIK